MVLGISKLSRKLINLSVLPNSEPRNDNARSQNRQKAGPSGSSPLIAALRRATTPRLALKDQARKVLALLRSRRPKSTPHLSKGPRAAARASGGTTGASSHSRILPLLPVGKPCKAMPWLLQAGRSGTRLAGSWCFAVAQRGGWHQPPSMHGVIGLFREVCMMFQSCRRYESRSVRMLLP